MIEVKEKPINEEEFDGLKILAKEILDILEEEGIFPIAHGSLILFGLIKDINMSINDFDFLVDEEDIKEVFKLLKEAGIKCEYHEDIHSIQIDEGLKIKIDSMDFLFGEEKISKEDYNFGGLVIKGLSAESLKKAYFTASQKNKEFSKEYMMKYEILNKISKPKEEL